MIHALPIPNTREIIATPNINATVLNKYRPRTVDTRCDQSPSLSPMLSNIKATTGQNSAPPKRKTPSILKILKRKYVKACATIQPDQSSFAPDKTILQSFQWATDPLWILPKMPSLLSDWQKACPDQWNRIRAATAGQMNRLLVEQDWQQVEHNSRPDLLFNYFPTDPGLANYISRLSRQLVHHLTDALID